ncbi:hypothetical protein [Serratia rubidaea]|uniref:hypothetical protein n=1 Tax=Serratia rubidaea TaxID=61652 RepID=UPI001F2FB980|nr:hypothetical protein [Serratia rubidaea]MDC6108901.1 hypothetical protein [Serratia rubidaea]UJD82231.1 hypothetical protein FS596_21950 [Serratia rubidaea]UJD86795.1 hypothetical protein FS595_21945 [Serratia rubidaea]
MDKSGVFSIKKIILVINGGTDIWPIKALFSDNVTLRLGGKPDYRTLIHGKSVCNILRERVSFISIKNKEDFFILLRLDTLR